MSTLFRSRKKVVEVGNFGNHKLLYRLGIMASEEGQCWGCVVSEMLCSFYSGCTANNTGQQLDGETRFVGFRYITSLLSC